MSNLNRSTLSFYKGNIVTLQELTRTNKLTEILGNVKKEQMYVIKDMKKGQFKGAIVDIDYLDRLLEIEEEMKAYKAQIFNLKHKS